MFIHRSLVGFDYCLFACFSHHSGSASIMHSRKFMPTSIGHSSEQHNWIHRQKLRYNEMFVMFLRAKLLRVFVIRISLWHYHLYVA